MLRKVTIDRLTKIRDHLFNNVKDENFYLGSWAGTIDHPFEDGQDIISCGTTACAIGHACSIPEFKKLGLALIPCDSSTPYEAIIYYKGKTHINAVMAFLELKNDDEFLIKEKNVQAEFACKYLFHPVNYSKYSHATRYEVISRITSFVEENS